MCQRLFLAATLCLGGTWACNQFEPASPSENPTETFALERDQNGDLRYCDADDAEDCVIVSNPSDCTVLQIEIDTITGATCERCLDSAGEVTYERCDETAIACTLVTAPEPDCVVCAHIDGPVIYSTCVPAEPEHCEYYPIFDSAGNVRECERCYDRRGNIISDSCGPDCSTVACAAVECAPGYKEVVPPGECCPICVPEHRCEDDATGSRVCPDVAIPICPEGYAMVRDPNDCCSYYCEPRDCSFVQCPWVDEDCPAGYHWNYDFPNCCGVCVPDDEPDRCKTDDDCGPERFCSEPVVCESQCTGAAGDPTAPCEAECWGYCRPFECPPPTPGAYVECEGEWVDPGHDGNGCPRPPVCVCADGTEAPDGKCLDRCALVDCAPGDPTTCDADEEWTTDYPYCCGVCVKKDQALCRETGGKWELGCGHTNCTYEVQCIQPEEGCNCGPRMSWVDGEGCVADPACSEGEPCEYEGEEYPSGSEFPAGDGCNSCFCLDGRVTCTLAACAECWGAYPDADGACRAPNGGLYPESCCDEAQLCLDTNGAWDEGSCGHYYCGQFPACDAVIPGCDCGPTAIFVAGTGCIESDECRNAAGCTTASGERYEEGDTWPKGDGCNNCTCVESAIYCTEAACTP